LGTLTLAFVEEATVGSISDTSGSIVSVAVKGGSVKCGRNNGESDTDWKGTIPGTSGGGGREGGIGNRGGTEKVEGSPAFSVGAESETEASRGTLSGDGSSRSSRAGEGRGRNRGVGLGVNEKQKACKGHEKSRKVHDEVEEKEESGT